jgi:hypothetical protein
VPRRWSARTCRCGLPSEDVVECLPPQHTRDALDSEEHHKLRGMYSGAITFPLSETMRSTPHSWRVWPCLLASALSSARDCSLPRRWRQSCRLSFVAFGREASHIKGQKPLGGHREVVGMSSGHDAIAPMRVLLLVATHAAASVAINKKAQPDFRVTGGLSDCAFRSKRCAAACQTRPSMRCYLIRCCCRTTRGKKTFSCPCVPSIPARLHAPRVSVSIPLCFTDWTPI